MTHPGEVSVSLRVNGTPHRMRVPASTTLLQLLRDHLRLTGSKEACGVGECGACTVLVDGEPAVSCLMLAAELHGCAVTTIENTSTRLGRLRRAFAEHAALQCGFCTPGMILAASRLPADAKASEIRAALAGNICRCTGYTRIVRAVQHAGRRASKK